MNHLKFNLFAHFRSSAAPPKLPPSSYTNPAYFIFEGISVARRVEEAPPTHRKDAQVIWSGNEALQLPKISGHQAFNRRPCRRSDFTEIEIPAVPPQFTPANDLYAPSTNSSYQLFPDKNPSPVPKHSGNASLQYQERTSQPRDKYQGKNVVKDSILPEKNLRNLYMNHSAIIREETRQDQHQLLPERTKPVRAAKVPSPFPYIPTHLAHCPVAVPWMMEQQPPAPTGDNSLTALQIAKSLSEVDFFPSEQRGPSVPSQRPSYRNGPSLHGDGCYSWEKEVRQPLAQRQDVFYAHLRVLQRVIERPEIIISAKNFTLSWGGFDSETKERGEETLTPAASPEHLRTELSTADTSWTEKTTFPTTAPLHQLAKWYAAMTANLFRFHFITAMISYIVYSAIPRQN